MRKGRPLNTGHKKAKLQKPPLIPALDIARARKFYETIFEIKMQEMEMPDMQYAMFPFDPAHAKVAGALAKSALHTPSATGCIIYLNANPDLQNVLDRIAAAGGKVTMPKTSIGPNGFMAFFADTEGMAWHSIQTVNRQAPGVRVFYSGKRSWSAMIFFNGRQC